MGTVTAVTRDGIIIKGSYAVEPKLVAIYARLDCEATQARAAWIAKLRSEGIAGAHPDDGWVDRQAGSIQFVYPHYADAMAVGKLWALGDYWRWRIVRLVRYEAFRSDPSYGRWYFIDEPAKDLAHGG